DPLIAGNDKVFGTADDLPAYLRFMTLTRATQTIDANGVAQHTNVTTSYVDQNQTYTSHASHQVFLREYVRVGEQTLSTGNLLDGQTNGVSDGTIGTWADVKANALLNLGITLTDRDVGKVPLLVTDAYGNLVLGPNGYAQMVMAPDATHATNWVQEGTAAGITTAGSINAGLAFLVDIAHSADPGNLAADADNIIGNAVAINPLTGQRLEYDNELLDAHFVTGDGRGNENIGLTAVHSVFHAEHNRVVEADKLTILASGDIAFINEWLRVDLAAGDTIPTDPSLLQWDGARLFQAARFTTEMQYQHMVFEEFARRIQPAVNPFVFTNTVDINPSILAEFAHTVYRFGHSMLTDSVDRLTNDLTLVGTDTEQVSLIEAFLNPVEYLDSGPNFDAIQGALFRGMSRDVGSEIDEFIVPALRSNLLGLPLDLAALNIARGRDVGVPTLNETRTQLYNDFGYADLKPYVSWNDFAQHMRNPISLINFIAAYGNHAAITNATTLEAKRDAATLLVFGDGSANGTSTQIGNLLVTNADRLAFLNGKGIYAAGAGERGGLDNIDLWIGGLAEQINEFGGMLGSTFNFIFEYQMENLQNGDRLYYLSRTQGLNLLTQLEQNTFTDILSRNSDLGEDYATHMNAHAFVTPDMIFELDRHIAQEDYNPTDPDSRDPVFAGLQEALTPKVVRDYSTTTTDGNGHDVGGEIHFLGGEHVVIGGTEGNDTMTSDKGIDALYGDGGNDYLNAGMESDEVFGGAGDDIIEDPFGDDFLRGGEGNGVITAARGLDILFGGSEQDAIFLGQDGSEVFAGSGNDFVLGGDGSDNLLGNEGDDWIEGGEALDVLSGDDSELFFNSTIIGHDVLWGQGNDTDYDMESGDDIAFTGPGIQRFEGMFGFDWAITKYDVTSNRAIDLRIGVALPTDIAGVLRDRYDLVEAASGWDGNDTIIGDNRSALSVAETAFTNHILTAEGVARIDGFAAWLAGARETLFGAGVTTFRDGNILMGGAGNDVLTGNAGFDIMDGDSWLNVRIRVMVGGVEYSAESISTTAGGPFGGKLYNLNPDGSPNFGSVAFGGQSLASLLLDRTVNPGNMSIVREIVLDDGIGDSDSVVFAGTSSQYTIEGRGANVGGFIQVAYDLNGDGFISVSENVAGVNDDTDLVRNFEHFVFSDVTLNLADVISGPPTNIGFSVVVPGNGLPGVGSQIASLTSDSLGVTFSVAPGSNPKFAVNAAGSLTLVGPLVQNQTSIVEVNATNAGGTYSEFLQVRVGSILNVSYTGGTAANIIYALGGNDSVTGNQDTDALFGQAGNDSLYGGAADDLLVGGIGVDLIDGGNGADQISWKWGDGIDATDGGAGIDRMEIIGNAANNGAVVTFDGTSITSINNVGTITGVEAITMDLLGGTDLLSYSAATATGVSINLTAGTASGFASIANIENATGSTLNDTITGNSGSNVFLGVGGDDLFIATVDDVLDDYNGGAGFDTADYSAYSTGLSINLSVLGPVTVFGSGTVNDIVRSIDNLVGGTGSDNFVGTTWSNTLLGGGGGDQMDGGSGNDVLNGGAGADMLIGGLGRDSLTGGSQNDVFVFVSTGAAGFGANSDTILDFEGAGAAAGDMIDLSGIASGFSFIGTAAFAAGATNQVQISFNGTDTFISIDTDLDTAAEAQIRLTGNQVLTADDFIF
ncbi:MAG: heme peroxidase, partial [Candidatus Saccharibacteria bacterium]|nr:heme peroxidase [Pseudorhodobacter sp.]